MYINILVKILKCVLLVSWNLLMEAVVEEHRNMPKVEVAKILGFREFNLLTLSLYQIYPLSLRNKYTVKQI